MAESGGFTNLEMDMGEGADWERTGYVAGMHRRCEAEDRRLLRLRSTRPAVDRPPGSMIGGRVRTGCDDKSVKLRQTPYSLTESTAISADRADSQVIRLSAEEM